MAHPQVHEAHLQVRMIDPHMRFSDPHLQTGGPQVRERDLQGAQWGRPVPKLGRALVVRFAG